MTEDHKPEIDKERYSPSRGPAGVAMLHTLHFILHTLHMLALTEAPRGLRAAVGGVGVTAKLTLPYGSASSRRRGLARRPRGTGATDQKGAMG